MTTRKKAIASLALIVVAATVIWVALRLLAPPEADFFALDRNGDRVLTPEEWVSPNFTAADASQDGLVTAIEFYAHIDVHARKRPPSLQSFYEAADRNRDGSLDRLEFPFGDSIYDRLRQPTTPESVARQQPLIDSLVTRVLSRPWGWFALRDRNGDGMVSTADGAARRNVVMQDLNQDGAVSLPEVQEQRRGSPRLTLAYIVYQLDRTFDRVDRDGDGMLDSLELAGRHAVRRFVDINEDGSISRQEVFIARDSARVGVHALQRHMLRIAFAALDHNLDGALTPQELEGAGGRMELADANRDRRITLDELLAEPAVFEPKSTPIRLGGVLRRERHTYPLPPQRDSLGRVVSPARR